MYNQRYLIRHLRGLLTASPEREVAVLMLDVDHFKQVNDEYGHDVGDAVLQELARRLAGAVRANDMVARYAGDEFLVMLDSVDRREDAERVCATLAELMAHPLGMLPADGERPELGASIGYALYPEDGQDVETLIRHADQQMYRRKRQS